MDTAGYDPDTRLYYEGRAPALKLQDHIHRDEARAAADYLLEPFAEFPFVDPVLDRSVVLAYTLTLVQRPQLVLAPLFGVSARSPGTGKGLLTEACNLIARGRDAAIMPPTSGNNAEEETRKRITALLLQGAPSVVLDNWTSAVGGDSLNVLLTAPEWTDRLLGGNETITVPARVTWAATGNNLIVYGDMVRRTLLMSLDAKTERPEQRRFKITNLGKHILQRRGELLSAAYTILRGYRAAGSPEQEGPLLGRFEEWSRAVAAPIRWLGLPDPVLSQERLRATDPETARLSALLNAWWDLLGDRTVTLGQLLEEINGFETVVPESESGGERRAALREALEDVAGERGQINRRKLGWFLRHTDQRVCDGYILFRSTGNVAKYRVAKAEGGGP